MAKVLHSLAIRLAGPTLALLAKTMNFQYGDGQGFSARLLENDQAIIMAFWHSHLLMMPWAYLRPGLEIRPLNALVSQSRDGEIMAQALSYLGVSTVRGSSTRGGMQAFSKMTKLLREEHHIAIIPDGPKGPPRELKSGVLKLAQLTGKPIVPFGWNATRFRRLGSWDKMVLPLPFSTIHFDTGSKIFVPREATDDQLASIGEKLCSELDRVSGYL